MTMEINCNKPKKQKSIGAPIILGCFQESPDVTHPLIGKFKNSPSADEQLGFLKNIIKDQTDSCDRNVAKFLAGVYYEAPAKHPVKCFLTKQITKCISIQQPFTESLSELILEQLKGLHKFEQYAEVVPKVVACIENFPAGAAAVKCIEEKLAKTLVAYFGGPRYDALRDIPYQHATTKIDIYSLDHLIVRLLVHIIQKLDLYDIQHNECADWRWLTCNSELLYCVELLICDEDVPLDTKCLSAILIMHYEKSMERSYYKWSYINRNCGEGSMNDPRARIMRPKAGQLAVYAAIASLLSAKEVEDEHNMYYRNESPLLLQLLTKLLSIAQSASDQALTLGVARSLVQLSKLLKEITVEELGLKVVELVLQFVWPHLDHHLDSVRHLTQQLLAAIISYCAQLEKEVDDGNPLPLAELLESLRALGSCKSLYWGVSHAAGVLGARRVLQDLSPAPVLLAAAVQPHLQAAATTAIEALLEQHVKEADCVEIFEQWVRVVLERVEGAECSTLAVLEGVLTTAVRHCPGLVTHIESYMRSACSGSVLLQLVIARAVPACRALLAPSAMRAAMLQPALETRILSLSVVVESRKSTQPLSNDELVFVLDFLRYNINAQSHNFRQLMLANMKKLLKRLADSWRVMSRQGEAASAGAHYVTFWEQLRQLCYSCALRGANYGRRNAALQLLAWLHTAPCHWVWKEEHVETLLLHLDDGYEANKALALQILQHCPEELLKKTSYSTSLQLTDILQQASTLKPSQSVSAAYKLQLLLDKLPERVLEGNDKYNTKYTGESAVRSAYTLMVMLTWRANHERCGIYGVCEVARRGGLFGALHCLSTVLRREDVRDILWSRGWHFESVEVTNLCLRVLDEVLPVVSAASPEGYLPPDLLSGDYAEDVKPVTAQMVLVCAWRSVKEVSSVLGCLAAAIPACRQPNWQAMQICEALVAVLDQAQHRGAVEQAARGLSVAAQRFWRDPVLAELPKRWLRMALEVVTSETGAERRGTRRGAGLPYMIQVLVTTELNTPGRGEHFHDCMATLMRLAASNTATATATAPAICAANALSAAAAPAAAPATPNAGSAQRALCANILRALFRATGVESAVVQYVGEGLRVAACGFAAAAWPERNAMCLLFGALCVRAFGVERLRGADVPDRRNMCSGRLFFQRYPRLYDVMHSILKEASEEENGVSLQPSLFPVLLLLSRLYPSALEGTDSNLKLSSFIPAVVKCARSGVLHVRRLAARALRPLIAPTQFIPHLEWMFNILSESSMARNYCHGILLQVAGLLATPPAHWQLQGHGLAAQLQGNLARRVHNTVWILEQCLGPRPCFVIADEFTKLINLLVWRFPEFIQKDTVTSIKACLEKLLFSEGIPPITTGRDICLANCLYLYLILLHKDRNLALIVQTTQTTLQHKSHEVVMATLNYYLMLHSKYDNETKLEKHLSSICDAQVLEKLRQTPTYVTILIEKIHGLKYHECIRKCVRLLTLERGTQRAILKEPTDSNEHRVINRLFNCIEYAHETVTHMYLDSLLNFMKEQRDDLNFSKFYILPVMRVIVNLSSADNSDETRDIIISHLETNIEKIVSDMDKLMHDNDKFEYKATVLATLVTFLEDNEEGIRQRAANVAARLPRRLVLENVPGGTVPHETGELLPSVRGETLRDYVESLEDNVALFVVLALFDFNSEVCMTDDIGDECRVFDQGERYNIFLEETVWTVACADKIIKIKQQNDVDLIDFVLSIVRDKKYSYAFKRLCKGNVTLFQKMAKDASYKTDDNVNPKVELFLRKLHL